MTITRLRSDNLTTLPRMIAMVIVAWSCSASPMAISLIADDTPKISLAKPSFRTARDHFLRGDYEKAIQIYETLGRTASEALRAACGRSDIDLLIGDYQAGIRRLKAIEASGKKSVEWHTSMAALLASVGDYHQALSHNRRAVAMRKDDLRAHWQLGKVLETVGRSREAVRAYEIFEDIMSSEQLPDDAAAVTWLGQGFYRYSVLSRHTNLVSRTRHVLSEVFQEVFEFIDGRYWPARLAAANLLLSKHNLPEARADFEKILEQNPHVPGAMVGLGQAALEDWDFEEAEKQAEAALKVNPNHVAAWLLLAEIRMTTSRFGEAANYAEKALAINANSIGALGILASAKWLTGEKSAAKELEDKAKKISAAPAAYHFAMGRWLAASRQYTRAEPQFRKAMDEAPTWPEPATSLGQLYMDIGEEGKARRTLESSFKLDSFNRHTHNILELLDRLDMFARLESEHFILKYDDKEDAVAAPYFSRQLEDMYTEVCEDFNVKLDKRTIIELFPSHMGFSVRVAGRPYIGTVGACSGRVIAMAAPRGRPPFGRFNWVDVLRHEFTHTVTLAATANRIPHWMTEGLAVYEEPSPRSWRQKKLLSDTVRRNRLFTLDSINWGFVRPRRPNGRELAYAQSEWMVQYIIHRYRYKAILDLLQAFANGSIQEKAFKDVLKIDQDQFDQKFKAWATKQVARWGLPVVTVEDPGEIRVKLADRPEDAALWGRLARAEFLDGKSDPAQEAAQRALELDENQTVALEVMGHILVTRMLSEEKADVRKDLINEVDPYMRRLNGLVPDNPVAIKYLGYVEQAWEQWPEAIDLYRTYQRRFPEDPDTFRRLAGIYLRRKDHPAALKQLESLARLVNDEPAVARQIASIHSNRGAHAQAAHWYRQALNIDPYDVDTHGALADEYYRLKKNQDALNEYKVVCRLLPEDAIGYEGLSRVYRAIGNHEKAAAYKKEAAVRRGKQSPEGVR